MFEISNFPYSMVMVCFFFFLFLIISFEVRNVELKLIIIRLRVETRRSCFHSLFFFYLVSANIFHQIKENIPIVVPYCLLSFNFHLRCSIGVAIAGAISASWRMWGTILSVVLIVCTICLLRMSGCVC